MQKEFNVNRNSQREGLQPGPLGKNAMSREKQRRSSPTEEWVARQTSGQMSLVFVGS